MINMQLNESVVLLYYLHIVYLAVFKRTLILGS